MYSRLFYLYYNKYIILFKSIKKKYYYFMIIINFKYYILYAQKIKN